MKEAILFHLGGLKIEGKPLSEASSAVDYMEDAIAYIPLHPYVLTNRR